VNQKLILAVLSALSLPLTAQKGATDPDLAYNLQLYVAASSMSLSGMLVANPGFDDDKAGFGMVCANITGRTLQIPGLPTLIDPQVILAAGPLSGAGLKWIVPFHAIPYDLHVQGGGLIFGELQASPIHTVWASPAEPKPVPPLPEETPVAVDADR